MSLDFGIFVSAPDETLLKVVAVDGTAILVAPVPGGEQGAEPGWLSESDTREMTLHAVNKGLACHLEFDGALSGTRLEIDKGDAELQQLIEQQTLKGVVSVPAFFQLAQKRASMGNGPSDEGAHAFYAPVPPSSHHGVWSVKRASAYFATLGFAILLGFLLVDRNLQIADTSSLITSDYNQIESPVTGTVIFVNDSDTITAGEPVFGIEGTSGRPVIVNAPISSTTFEPVTVPGARIERGRTLGRIADEAAAPQLIAYVSFSQALDIAKGAIARVSYRDQTVSFLPLGLADIRYSVRDQDTNNPLMKIQVNLPDEFRHLVGETASIQIRRDGRLFENLCKIAGSVRQHTGWCDPKIDYAA